MPNVDRTGINEKATEQILEILKALPRDEALRTADYVHRLVEYAVKNRPEMMKPHQEAKAKKAK